MSMRHFLALFLFLPAIGQAATLPVINGSGALVQFNEQVDALGAFSARNLVCDGTNPDICAPVSATAGLTVLPLSPIPGNFNATVFQSTAANLQATVSQGVGNNLHVVVDSCTGCGSGGGGLPDENAFTFGTTTQLPIGGVYQTTATSNPLTSGQSGVAQITAYRAMHMNLRNSSGVEIGTASTPVQVSIANTAANSTAIVTTSTLSQGGSALSATNGIYTNMLMSNAVVAPGNPVYVSAVPSVGTGLSAQSAIVPNNTTSVAIGSSAPHQLYGLDGYSISAATPVYVKFYNATQGSTTCGSGTPVLRYTIPASGGSAGSGQIMHDPNGVSFSTALSYCVTAGIGDSDTTTPASNSYVLNVYYK